MTDIVDKKTRSHIMSRIRSSNTTPEEKLFDLVRSTLGHRWRIERNYSALEGTPDVYIPSLFVVIFVDGCFFHSCPIHGHIPYSNSEFWQRKFERNIARDIRQTKALRRLGYSVWRFWEHSFHDNLIVATHQKIANRLYRQTKKIRV